MALAWREHHQHPGCTLHGGWGLVRGSAEGVHVCLRTRGLRIRPEKPPTPSLHPVASVTHDNEMTLSVTKELTSRAPAQWPAPPLSSSNSEGGLEFVKLNNESLGFGIS